MHIQQINSMLSEVREKLVSFDLSELSEMNKFPSEHHKDKMSAAKTRLQQLYDKLTAGRSDATKVKAYGAKR
jgi:hypothetical protein